MNYEMGKKIFYDNYGSSYFMSKNGELFEYQKCNIEKKDEEVWKFDILKNIISSIISGKDIGLIWNLSYMDITQDQKTSAYNEIKEKGDKKKIKEKILLLKPLFEQSEFIKLIEIFD